MKKLLMSLTVALLLTCGLDTANATNSESIRFGIDPTYAPYGSKDPSGKIVGFDVDLGDEICKRLNAKCVWVQCDFDGLIPALKARKFDAILSSMLVTPARAQCPKCSMVFTAAPQSSVPAAAGAGPGTGGANSAAGSTAVRSASTASALAVTPRQHSALDLCTVILETPDNQLQIHRALTLAFLVFLAGHIFIHLSH